MLKSAVLESGFIRSGRSTTHCEMQWIQKPFVVIRLMLPRRRTHVKAQVESQLLVRYRTKVSRSFFVFPCFFLIGCNPHQICRNFVSSSLMKMRMEPQLLGMYRTKVSGPSLNLYFFLIHRNLQVCRNFVSSSLTKTKKQVYSLPISFLCSTNGLLRGDSDGLVYG